MQSTLIHETPRGRYWRNETGAGEVYFSRRPGAAGGWYNLAALMTSRGEGRADLAKAKARNAALERSPVE